MKKLFKNHNILTFFVAILFGQGFIYSKFMPKKHQKAQQLSIFAEQKRMFVDTSLQPPTQKGVSFTQLTLGQNNVNLANDSSEYRTFVKERIKNSNFVNFEELSNLKIENTELTFAFVGPMIGVAGFYSHEIISGILTHFEEVNRSGGLLGLRLRLLIINDYNDPETTNKIVNYLMNKHQIYFFLGNHSDENLFSIYSLIKDKKITTLFPNIKNKIFLSPFNKQIINGGNNEELLVDKILEFTVHNLALKKRVGVFYPDNEVGRYFANYIKTKFNIMRLPPPCFVSFNPENPEYLAASKTLIDFKPEAVISLGNYIASARLGSYFLLNKHFQTNFIGTDELFFSTKILEDFLFSSNSKGGLLKMFYASFVPNPSLEEYPIVENYLENLKKTELFLNNKKGFYPSPISLSYYLNTKILTLALLEAISLNKDTSFYSSDFQRKLIIRLENLKDMDIGGFLIGFDSLNRCAYYLEPHVIAAVKS